MNIVGFAGKAQSGKTSAAKALISYGFDLVSFAGGVKTEVWDFLDTCGVDFEPRHLYGTGKDKEERLRIDTCRIPEPVVAPKAWILGEVVDFSARELMQWWGMMRREYSPDYWVNKAMHRAMMLLDRGLARGVAFDDVRFPNEYNAICSHGGKVVRIVRQGLPAVYHGSEHESETALDDWTMPVICNNGIHLGDFENYVLHRLLHALPGS
jgi:hypothetical protein